MTPRPCTRFVIFGLLLFATVGCGRTLSSLYEDYRIENTPIPSDEIHKAIVEAVTDAGWKLDKSAAPNVISTEEVTVAQWGLYKIVVSLDLAPINGTHVRVFVHPYRVYLWGARSKMPYMSRRVRNYVLPDLSETLAQHGIVALDVNLAEEAAGD